MTQARREREVGAARCEVVTLACVGCESVGVSLKVPRA